MFKTKGDESLSKLIPLHKGQMAAEGHEVNPVSHFNVGTYLSRQGEGSISQTIDLQETLPEIKK